MASSVMELDFKFSLIVIILNLNLNNYLWEVAIVLDTKALDRLSTPRTKTILTSLCILGSHHRI